MKSLEKAAKEAPEPIQKAGKSLSSKNLNTLKGIYDTLGSFLSDFSEEDEPENNVKKEDKDMTHEEVQKVVSEEVAKAVEPITKQLEAITKAKPQENVYTILCSVLLGAIVTLLCDVDNINDYFNLGNNYPFALFIVKIIIFPFLIIFAVWIMYKVMLPLWSTNTESTFLNEYRKIIKRMLDK